jgi:hypothetical protein
MEALNEMKKKIKLIKKKKFLIKTKLKLMKMNFLVDAEEFF